MLNGLYDNEIECAVSQAKNIHNINTRNSQYTLHRSQTKTTLRKLAFKNLVVSFWNKLPNKVKEAPSLKAFESRLDRYWQEYDIKYDLDRCLEFEQQRLDPTYAGDGPRNIEINLNIDMELQAMI